MSKAKAKPKRQTLICPTCHHDVTTNAPELLLERINAALADVRRDERAAAFREAMEIIGGIEETDPECNTWTTDCIRALEAATKQPCPDCAEAARLAYSDAVTPGFFNPKCARHQTERATTTKQPTEVKEGL